MKRILVTGGLGYLGSHMVIELIHNGYTVVCVDNLHNSSEDIVYFIENIVKEKIEFVKANVEDTSTMEVLFSKYSFDAVIHFAGYKSIAESLKVPLDYYRNNYNSTLTILQLCLKYNSTFIFSSSATVYGIPQYLPLTEEHPLAAINPYGKTKLHIEQIIFDVANAYPMFNAFILRYFNPVGGGGKGFILGEHPKNVPTNVMPIICQVAAGIQKEIYIFGDDYETIDGTGVRDYIHVTDLIAGHMAALKKAEENKTGCHVYNLGTGKGISVLELIHTFEKVNNISVPYSVVARRSGDVASCYADATKAFRELDWKAQKGLEDMVYDSWLWQKNLLSKYIV